MAASNSERIKEFVEKIPLVPILFIYTLYVGYQYYDFTNSADSPLALKSAQLESIKSDNDKLREKLKQAQESTRILLQKQIELKNLAQQLSQIKAVLSNDVDQAVFMKQVFKEATAVGLNITGIKPDSGKSYEYYSEQPFDVSFKGYFVQLVVFLDRLTKSERIIRVDDFQASKSGNNLSPYVEVSGSVQVKTYRYLGSKADELAKDVSTQAPPSPSPPSNPSAGGHS